MVQPVNGLDISVVEQEYREICSLVQGMDFLLVVLEMENWREELSPWSAPPVFGNDTFGNGAGITLKEIVEDLLFPLVKGTGNKKIYLGGYSFSGLFALWAASQTEIFSGVVAVSPSVWFPDFREFIRKNGIHTQNVYLSLGDKEEKTKNVIMAQVGNNIRDLYGYCQEEQICSVLEWNPGNHFREPDKRMARGFGWLLKQEYKKEQEEL